MPEPAPPGSYPHPKKHDAFEWVGLLVGVLTLIAVATYTAVQICQTRLTRQAIETSTRPYIKVVLNPGSFGLGPNGADYQLTFTVGNYGKLPANANIQESTRWEAGSHSRGPKSFNARGLKFIFPDQPLPSCLAAHLPRLSDGEVVDLKSNGGMLIVDVMIQYNGHRVITCTRYHMDKGTLALSDESADSDDTDCNTAD